MRTASAPALVDAVGWLEEIEGAYATQTALRQAQLAPVLGCGSSLPVTLPAAAVVSKACARFQAGDWLSSLLPYGWPLTRPSLIHSTTGPSQHTRLTLTRTCTTPASSQCAAASSRRTRGYAAPGWLNGMARVHRQSLCSKPCPAPRANPG